MNKRIALILCVSLLCLGADNIRKTKEYRAAMRSYAKSHPNCEMTGLKPSFFGRNPDKHHYKSVSEYPEFACDTNNLVTLARDIHFLLGHLGNWQDENVNLRETMRAVKIAVAENAKSKKGNNKLLLRLHAEVEPYVTAVDPETGAIIRTIFVYTNLMPSAEAMDLDLDYHEDWGWYSETFNKENKS
jgi:hypothetical protein